LPQIVRRIVQRGIIAQGNMRDQIVAGVIVGALPPTRILYIGRNAATK
jgi:hypothetical protein